MYSPEMQAKIAVWRQKSESGTMTTEDYKQMIADLRGERKNAANASEQSKRTKAKAAVPDSKALLADLMGGIK